MLRRSVSCPRNCFLYGKCIKYTELDYSLCHSSVPFQIFPAFFTGEHKSEEFLKLNPTGEVPVLVDGETVVHEPVAILSYLAEKYTSYAGFGDSTAERMKVRG